MTKTEFIELLVKKYNISISEAQKSLTAIMDSIEDALLRDGKIQIKGFGSFSVTERKSRPGTNLQTGEKIVIPASRSVKFSPASALKTLINDALYEQIVKK